MNALPLGGRLDFWLLAATIGCASSATAQQAVWRIEERPTVDIGQIAGEPAYQLYGVRAAVRMTDGRIAIANSGALQVRVFDSSGRFVWAFGREGEGPGEFTSMDGMWAYRGDSLLLLDKRGRRFTVVGSAGRLGRVGSLGQGRAVTTLRGVFSDGSMLGESTAATPRRAEGDLFDSEVTLLRLTAAGALADSLGRFPQTRLVSRSMPSGVTTSLALYGPNSYFDARGTRLLLGTARQANVTLRDIVTGSTTRLALPDPLRRFTAADKQLFTRWALADATNAAERARKQSQVDLSDFTDVFATHGIVRLDAEGNAWVQRPIEVFRNPTLQTWWVFAPGGARVATVELPVADQILDVGTDYVLLLHRDQLDVEHVRQHRLVKSM